MLYMYQIFIILFFLAYCIHFYGTLFVRMTPIKQLRAPLAGMTNGVLCTTKAMIGDVTDDSNQPTGNYTTIKRFV